MPKKRKDKHPSPPPYSELVRKLAMPPPRVGRAVEGRISLADRKKLLFETALVLSNIHGPYNWGRNDLINGQPRPCGPGTIQRTWGDMENLRYAVCSDPRASTRCKIVLHDFVRMGRWPPKSRSTEQST